MGGRFGGFLVFVILLGFLFGWFGFWDFFFFFQEGEGKEKTNHQFSSYILWCSKDFQNVPFKTNSNNSSLKFKTIGEKKKKHKKP